MVQHLTSRNTRLVEAVVVGRHCRNTHIIKNRILKVTSSSSNLLSLRLVAIRDILYNNNINIITIDRSRAPWAGQEESIGIFSRETPISTGESISAFFFYPATLVVVDIFPTKIEKRTTQHAMISHYVLPAILIINQSGAAEAVESDQGVVALDSLLLRIILLYTQWPDLRTQEVRDWHWFRSTNVDMGRSLRRRIVPGSRIMSIRVGETVRSVVNPIYQRESQFSIFCPSIVTLPVLDPLVCTI